MWHVDLRKTKSLRLRANSVKEAITKAKRRYPSYPEVDNVWQEGEE
jgi:hypothetical protein